MDFDICYTFFYNFEFLTLILDLFLSTYATLFIRYDPYYMVLPIQYLTFH